MNVTIGIINYNGMATVGDTLNSVMRLRYPSFEMVVVDNNSTDGSREWIQKVYPEIHCICLNENIGVAGARNIILEYAATDFVFIIDNDICVEPNTLNVLMRAAQKHPRAGVLHPDIRDENDPAVHHYNGGWIHYLGAHISRSKPDPKQRRPSYEIFDVVSGAALLINRKAALSIGGFDSDYFFNWEDGDFTVRMTLAGYWCLNVPQATVHHRQKPRGTSKVYYQVRNRWYFILKLYSWKTIVLISPMLMTFEILQASMLLTKGVFRNYIRANMAVIKNIPLILAKRYNFCIHKKRRDVEWLRSGRMYIPAQLNLHRNTLKKLQGIYYKLCDLYWRMIKILC